MNWQTDGTVVAGSMRFVLRMYVRSAPAAPGRESLTGCLWGWSVDLTDIRHLWPACCAWTTDTAPRRVLTTASKLPHVFSFLHLVVIHLPLDKFLNDPKHTLTHHSIWTISHFAPVLGGYCISSKRWVMFNVLLKRHATLYCSSWADLYPLFTRNWEHSPMRIGHLIG